MQRPEAVRDLAVKQVGRSLEISFTAPKLGVDGESLTKPLEIEIVGRVLPPGTPAVPSHVADSSGETAAAPVVTLRSEDLARLAVAGKIEYRDGLSAGDFNRSVGARFAFQVGGLTRGFRGRPIEGDLSNGAALTLLDVPKPVTGLSIEPGQSALRLRWSPPAETITGRPAGFITNYRVYRSETGKPGSYRLLGVAHEATYDDSNFEFGRLYSYKVRALAAEGAQTAESEDSAAVEIVPRDTFPPAVPAGLTGLYTSGAIELIWSPNLEPDLAGYNVYRREEGAGQVKLNPELLHSPVYRDAAVTPGHRYAYRVTAVDRSGNESPPSAEAEVEAP